MEARQAAARAHVAAAGRQACSQSMAWESTAQAPRLMPTTSASSMCTGRRASSGRTAAPGARQISTNAAAARTGECTPARTVTGEATHAAPATARSAVRPVAG